MYEIRVWRLSQLSHDIFYFADNFLNEIQKLASWESNIFDLGRHVL